MIKIQDTWNAKCPIFWGNFTPKASNYCVENRALGFPGAQTHAATQNNFLQNILPRNQLIRSTNPKSSRFWSPSREFLRGLMVRPYQTNHLRKKSWINSTTKSTKTRYVSILLMFQALKDTSSYQMRLNVMTWPMHCFFNITMPVLWGYWSIVHYRLELYSKLLISTIESDLQLHGRSVELGFLYISS